MERELNMKENEINYLQNENIEKVKKKSKKVKEKSLKVKRGELSIGEQSIMTQYLRFEQPDKWMMINDLLAKGGL